MRQGIDHHLIGARLLDEVGKPFTDRFLVTDGRAFQRLRKVAPADVVQTSQVPVDRFAERPRSAHVQLRKPVPVRRTRHHCTTTP